MRQISSVLLLCLIALSLGACHCKTCFVGGPGDMCKPCPKVPKPLKPPREKSRCELPRWPDRPVKCVTTKVARKCCHEECHRTEEGYEYIVQVCEITYKSLYTDGSSKVWTEVTRNPVVKSPTSIANIGTRGNRTWRSMPLQKGSVIGDRCDSQHETLQSRVQHMDKNMEVGIEKTATQVGEDLRVAEADLRAEKLEFEDNVRVGGANIRHGLGKIGSKLSGNQFVAPKP